MLKDSGLLIEF
jgi:hypothetical protein